MNSIEIAEKLITDNMERIEAYRGDEANMRTAIANMEERIKQQEDALFVMKRNLEKRKEDLAYIRAAKLECLVDTLALKAFIDDGGGLDMLEEEE